MTAGRVRVTDPIQWIKRIIEYPTVALVPEEIEDGKAILEIAEGQRIGSLSAAELAAELAGTPGPQLLAEAARRLTEPQPWNYPIMADGASPEPGLPVPPSGLVSHLCFSADYPAPGGLACFCVHGVDHDEALFDVPRD